MTDTPLASILAKVSNNDIAENRLILFRRFLETELFILIDDPEDPRPQRVDPNPMCGGRMIRAQGYPPPACPCCGGDMQWRHQKWPPAEETCRSCAATRRHRRMTIDPATQEA